ncbi:uncharacterized protein EI90DRAFT_3060006 [Cantharellus anzutake]|uniref:uncharacterized protein n=1 Tax=Cantharellus anzutake TaxID=1750568 RepID=UPI0019046907|nr:uncharacterized protein EI90DRAFT_3060006 [Cantharellus anzutake]KAF8330574.1 hypothetical protein EI90DRAFT_3060006 [Cantharellus anzutake]
MQTYSPAMGPVHRQMCTEVVSSCFSLFQILFSECWLCVVLCAWTWKPFGWISLLKSSDSSGIHRILCADIRSGLWCRGFIYDHLLTFSFTLPSLLRLQLFHIRYSCWCHEHFASLLQTLQRASGTKLHPSMESLHAVRGTSKPLLLESPCEGPFI